MCCSFKIIVDSLLLVTWCCNDLLFCLHKYSLKLPWEQQQWRVPSAKQNPLSGGRQKVKVDRQEGGDEQEFVGAGIPT